jgi:tRNA(Ile)-lysidine synthase
VRVRTGDACILANYGAPWQPGTGNDRGGLCKKGTRLALREKMHLAERDAYTGCLLWMNNYVTNSPSGHELERRLAESWPVREWCDLHVVLGVSGGADSVALLRAIAALKEQHGGRGELYVGHLNHGLRGSAADEDEVWLRSLCDRLKLKFEVEKRDISKIAAEEGDGWEAAARSARYVFLQAVAERLGARFVATAHTANDQVETVLHRIVRGTGIDGLAGMAKARALTPSVALLRPMLGLKRQDVLDYLAAIEQEYRTDATNRDTRWTRNRLRHELLPQLREGYNPQVDAALLRLALQAGEAQQVVGELAATLAERCVNVKLPRIEVDRAALQGQPAIAVREVFKFAWRQAGWPEQSMGFEEWQQLALLAADQGASMLNLPGGIRVACDGQLVVLEVDR